MSARTALIALTATALTVPASWTASVGAQTKADGPASDVSEEIPDGAMLRHRDVVLPESGVQLRLTAYRTSGIPHWSATVTGISVNGAHEPALPVIQESGATPEAAFDALEA